MFIYDYVRYQREIKRKPVIIQSSDEKHRLQEAKKFKFNQQTVGVKFKEIILVEFTRNKC